MPRRLTHAFFLVLLCISCIAWHQPAASHAAMWSYTTLDAFEEQTGYQNWLAADLNDDGYPDILCTYNVEQRLSIFFA